jgi:peroxin-1
MVYCGFPSERERAAILAAAARSLPLAPDVRLAGVAARTQGFSGADLAAILSEAQLLAVHEQIEQQEQSRQSQQAGGAEPASERHAPQCVVAAAHIGRALGRARPSLPPAERARLEGVYARFQQSRDPCIANRPVLPDGPDAPRHVKHATLA